jgi:hypothetical protein
MSSVTEVKMISAAIFDCVTMITSLGVFSKLER